MKHLGAASAVILIAGILTGTLAGCGDKPVAEPPSGNHSDGAAENVTTESVDGNWLTPDMDNAVALVEEEGVIKGFEVVIGGSGSQACAPVIDRAAVEDALLRITLVPPEPDQVCTADLRPYNFRLTFPEADTIEQVLIDFSTDYDHQESFNRKEFIAPQQR